MGKNNDKSDSQPVTTAAKKPAVSSFGDLVSPRDSVVSTVKNSLAASAQSARNKLHAEQVRGVSLAREYMANLNELEREKARAENISVELDRDRAVMEAEKVEAETRKSTALARADEVIAQHDLRSETYAADKAEARVRRMRAVLAARKLEGALADTADREQTLADLKATEADLLEQQTALESKIEQLLGDDDEAAAAERSAVNRELRGVQVTLNAVREDIALFSGV